MTSGTRAEAGSSPGAAGSGPAPLQTKSLAQYGFIAMPLACAGLPVYLHAPDYYATTLGQSLTALGLVLLALRFIDAFQDPFIGSVSDTFHKYRQLILIIGMVLLGAGFWMIFNPFAPAPLTWFAISVFLCTTGFSIVTINLQALGGTWVSTTHDRTRITGWREGFGLIGLLVASITPTLLGVNADPDRAFSLMSLLYFPLLFFGGFLLLRWMRTAHISKPADSYSLPGWKDIVSDPWRRMFFAISLLNVFASSLPAVLVMFFIRDRLNAEEYAGLFLLIYFLSGALSMFVWQYLSRQVGKVRAWSLSMAVAILTFVWAALLGPGDIYPYAAVCALSGLALGADLAIPPSILADHISQTKRQSEASRMFSMMTLISKAAFALATGLALPALGLVGYKPGGPMTETLGLSLSIAYAAVPSALKAATLFWVLAEESALSLDRKDEPPFSKRPLKPAD
ncbi:Na+/melibiose symporter-like transporter [Roseibium hamelinense]|uniref:Na+/melibiose symporter-like transporter n=1 Tax=Roseibium hamelinense TaxID=150831 RepID=A0A562SZC3_9HYPH|nr:MFS transporter [Roseibium hamelinense]MTI43669.1 MFS transporter [Roseibium hamelinense]TWI86186.1 Na+/melibiose symporter-like transporter [Roseibium hamelinense]